MALTASLGRWQLSRAAQKEGLQTAILQRQQLPALDGATLARPLPAGQARELMHRGITLRGRWLPEHTLFLDNRPMAGQTGFYVFTPLMLTGSGRAVLVQRGWVPRHRIERTKLPPVETPGGEVQISGRIAEHPPRVYQLGDEQGGPIRQNLDLDALRAETGLPLATVLVVQSGAASQGLRRDWPEVATGVEKHYGYAFQWFGLCALMGVLLLWFQVVRPLYRARRS
ncbi:SURF1 family protein [Ottowia testudinis]|uniref:SURF1-like protein n=2 Tax=Ottowia testudinis TaxID=2816950 RepID=A0A975H515_9BURK|nr:SURF1 family protein [Ottowia testudinis]QTD47434.1 SURF1 family protein [Ottowia testudinis]